MSSSAFEDLKNKRKTKSYVNTPTDGEATSNELASVAPTHTIYKDLPTSHLQIRDSESSGRGLWAIHGYRPGDTIISTKPHIAVLSTSTLGICCSSCFAPSASKRCTQCRAVCYCNSVCQNGDWALHKHECGALQRWARAAPSPEVSIPNDAVRAVARMLWKRQKKGPDSIWSQEIDAMQSHRGSLQTSSAATIELHTDLAHFLVQYLGVSSPSDLTQYGIKTPIELVDIISRFITNTFTLTDPSLTPIGASISPLVALINHSCDPNAVVVFPQPGSMQVIAIKEISAGQEVLTAYIDTTLPKALRLKSLKDTYHFDCICSLCSATAVDAREAVWCPDKSCGGLCTMPTDGIPETRCIKCRKHVVTTESVLDAVRVSQEGLEKATALQNTDPAKSLQLTSNLIPILLSNGLPPSAHPLLALNRLHQSLLLSTDELDVDEAIRAAHMNVTGLTRILSVGHPIVGLATTELGKLLAVDEPASPSSQQFPPRGPPRLKLAYDTLVRARDMLKIGFGVQNEGGLVGKEVREMVIRLEKEIGVWKEGVRNVRELS